MKSLWVNYNQLNGIPATLEFCESLEGIYAHGNQIEFLSTALCRIPKLKHLGVGRNRYDYVALVGISFYFYCTKVNIDEL